MTERLSASNASKHMACHASAHLELAIPNWTPPEKEDTAASSRGTNMHHIMELVEEYTPKQMLGIAEAIRYVAELRQRRRFKQLIEADGTGWWLQNPPKTRADVVLYVQNEIHVLDHKFGTIPVDVVGNEQGMYYALAFLPLAPKAKGVYFHILQPFADNFDSVFFSLAELEAFRQKSVATEAAILAGSVQFTPGEHCKFCPANPHGRGVKGHPFCPAMMKKLYPRAELDVNDALS